MFLLFWTSKIPLQKPVRNLSKNLPKSRPQKVEFAYIYIYIYSILEQPGLTLEREAPFNCKTYIPLEKAMQAEQSSPT